jgi:cytochrome c-type biogenesis protein CcmH/NrfG
VPGALDHVRVWLPRLRPIAVRSQVGLGVLLIALTLAVYWPAVRFGFVVFDDPRYVTDNFYVMSGLSLRGIRWAFTTFHDSNWIPLTWLSLMLDATLYGRWAGGFHATNILLHVANVLLVFLCLTSATGRTWRSAFVAALFAVHPLHVESVAWISERKDVLSMFCGLMSLCAYLRYARGGRLASLAVSLIFFAFSLASKQTFVTLPFVFLLLDFWPLRRFAGAPFPPSRNAPEPRQSVAPRIIEKLPFFVLSAAFCAVALWAQSKGHSVRSLTELPLSIRVLNAILAYGFYVQKALLPFGLAIFYPHPGPGLGFAGVAWAFGLVAAITLFAIATWRRWPFVLVGWFWFVGALVPMIGLVQVGVQQRADRYVYFPNLGLYIAIAWLAPVIASIPVVRRRALPAIAVVVVTLYAGIALTQVGYWRDGIVLMRHALAVTDDNPFARSVLGDALLGESRVDEALDQYRRTLELAPHEPNSPVTLGMGFYALKRFRPAADQFRAAIKLDERCAAAHTGLALALCGQRAYVAARVEFLRSLELDEHNAGACAGLAVLCRTLGDVERSIDYAERALRLDDTPFYCQRLMAIKLFDQGRLDEAIERWRQLVALAPGNVEIRAELRQAQAMKDDRAAPVLR